MDGSTGSLFSRIKSAQISCSLNNAQEFLPLDVLNKEITEDNVRNTLGKSLLLRTKLDHRPTIRVLPRTIVEQAKRIFVILLEIGQTDAIKKLLTEGLTDDDLPLRLEKDRTRLVSRTGKPFAFAIPMREQNIELFVERQWKFLAPSIDSSGQHIELDRPCPLPFSEAEKVKNTNTAIVYKCKLHPAHYSGPHLLGDGGYVATKALHNEEAFLKEQENLKSLASLTHDHVIKHIATFSKNGDHYVIFPWADGGTLADFWVREEVGRVKDTELILWYLRQMLGIAEAVEAFHKINLRHGDMKPENILHFRGHGMGRLVISDVGVSRSHQKETRLREAGTTTRATTPSYEAPEIQIHQSTPTSRKFDMWSIGCIFLELALWILHDMASINSFHQARHAPHYEFYLFHSESSGTKRKAEIHPVVIIVIGLLLQDPRIQSGTLFEAFIKLTEKRLLQIEAEHRAEATELAQELRRIVREAEADPKRLLNDAGPQDKLRLLPRAQTGQTVNSFNAAIPEHRAI